MSELELANANPAGGQPAGGNEPPAGSQATPPAVPPVETPSNEPMYSIKYKGQEEKLPVSKLIDFAQQGRDYSEKMGQLNSQIEARAQELTDAAIDKFYQEQEELANRNKPADPNAPPEEPDEFTSLKKTVDELKAEKEKEVFEKEVSNHVKELNSQLKAAVEKYPLANERNILAVLRSKPDANVEELAKYEHESEKTRRENWEKGYLEEAKKRGARGAEGAGGVAAAPGGKKISWNSTQEAVMELLEKQN